MWKNGNASSALLLLPKAASQTITNRCGYNSTVLFFFFPSWAELSSPPFSLAKAGLLEAWGQESRGGLWTHHLVPRPEGLSPQEDEQLGLHDYLSLSLRVPPHHLSSMVTSGSPHFLISAQGSQGACPRRA